MIGLHFFNPAPLMALVGDSCACKPMPISRLTPWRKWLLGGKTPAMAKDTPGFIVNRVARPFYSEALRILEEGIASVQDIDASLRAVGFRMGPFELMDLIGHDVNYAVTSTVHAGFSGIPATGQATPKDSWYRDWLGRNQERAFYTYEGVFDNQ